MSGIPSLSCLSKEVYPKLLFFGVIMPLDTKSPRAQHQNDTRHQTQQKPNQSPSSAQQKQAHTPGQTNPQRPNLNPQNPNQKKR